MKVRLMKRSGIITTSTPTTNQRMTLNHLDYVTDVVNKVTGFQYVLT